MLTEPTEPTETIEPDRTTLRRAVNELDAARARVEREALRIGDETRGKLVAELLPVLDNLDRTIRAAQDHGEGRALLDGVLAVRAQLETVLRGYGVQRIDAIGSTFDPSKHEAIAVIPIRDPARHSLVIDQVEPGYRFGDSLLRPAKVVVARLVA